LSQPTDRISQSEAVGLSLTDIASSGIEGRVNRELIAGLGESGLLDLIYSGDGVTAVDLCTIRQGLARTNTTAETALALQGLGGFPIHLSGSKETREQWIPRIKEGSVVAAFALTEPGAGSDAGSLAMTAIRDGEGFRLTGDKAFSKY
jgi:alkylation response protein AidB-like acyl-CoA dehydrogenase